MGQVAQKKMKSKKRTKESTANNITARDEKKEGTLNIKIKYEQSANESKLKMVKPDAKECHTASVIFNQQQSESQSSQKPKNTNKAIVVTPGEVRERGRERFLVWVGGGGGTYSLVQACLASASRHKLCPVNQRCTPLWTPDGTGSSVEVSPSRTTHCVLPIRKDSLHPSVLP